MADKEFEAEMKRRRGDKLQEAVDEYQRKFPAPDPMRPTDALQDLEADYEGDKLAKKIRKRKESDASALENQKKYGMKKGGSVSSASKRADGIAKKGKTRGKIV